ncbi:helix-turn-helix domain-containing protein [Nostoc sphaeroides]|uniref:XRE family transcriptional regulator n=1 Tax=Nostoc sphaeroides CCNUC1 TaxID=2653204 RepID=A0A5P8VUB3_9NOSO|nr:helix-turn-helix transcriptional regulator [Nostoc sphaeroides]MCC5628457.1 helix-turn-helix domain-containing protein [Nostoc sphaeroides CHAB 2801]QFS43726.1 XRE family transcriptional regulator [Nostoc sphaeroides CCNUC1]
MKEGSKYQPLLEFLRGNDQNEITLSFAEIETLINDILPESARNKRAWWSNRSKGALQASAWIEAGYRVEEVDFDKQQIKFYKPPNNFQVQLKGDTVLWNGELIKALRLHMGLTQAEFAERLGVYQQTVSQWENSAYQPTLATSKYLTLVADQAGFKYIETG